MNKAKHLNPTSLSDDELQRLAFAVAGKINEFFVVEKPLTREEAAAFLTYAPKYFDRLVSSGKVRALRFDNGAHPRFLPSMLLEDLKKIN